MLNKEIEDWDIIIKPKTRWFELNLRDILNYSDLLKMFVRRDIVVTYKQTILGPVWFFVQPVLTTAIYILVFGRIARLSTDGLPQILFYLSGIVIWNYFSDAFNSTSKTFIENRELFGKVYFPRLIIPMSKVISGLIKFLIQFSFFLVLFFYYLITEDSLYPNKFILLVPLLVLLMAAFGLGFGMIFSSLTTKYRDLTFVIQFGVQLLMYATPVIYPVSSVPEKYRFFILSNPLTPIVECFRYGFLGRGQFTWNGLAYSTFICLLILALGIILFNRIEKTFMDTV